MIVRITNEKVCYQGVEYNIVEVVDATVSEVYEYINWVKTSPDVIGHVLKWGRYCWIMGDLV